MDAVVELAMAQGIKAKRRFTSGAEIIMHGVWCPSCLGIEPDGCNFCRDSGVPGMVHLEDKLLYEEFERAQIEVWIHQDKSRKLDKVEQRG